MVTITTHEFVSKWKRVTACEKQIYQEHDNKILEKLLALNLERARG